MARLILLGAVVEGLVALIALFAGGGPAGGGVMAMVAALVGSSIAMGAQIAAIAMLKPHMQAKTADFTRAWGAGIAVRFGSFLVIAAVILLLRDVLPPAWVGAGYLGQMLVLLFAETRFLT